MQDHLCGFWNWDIMVLDVHFLCTSNTVYVQHRVHTAVTLQ